MSNIQAAIGCAQMERIEDLIASKRRIFLYYAEHLRGLPLKMNPELPGTTNGYWMPSIVVNEGVPFHREALLAQFKAAHIDGRVFFWPLSMLPMFEPRPENAVSYGLYERAVNLPSYQDLSEAEMERVVRNVQERILDTMKCEAGQ
jgi:perosamine synthetase